MPPKNKPQSGHRRKRTDKSNSRSSRGASNPSPKRKKSKVNSNLEEGKPSRRVIIRSINAVAETIWSHPEIGPCDKGLPVGTYIPDDATMDPAKLATATDEQVLSYRRLVTLGKDPRGFTKWGLINENIDGVKAFTSVKGADKCSPREANFDKGRSVEFFTEFNTEKQDIGRGGRSLEPKLINWFKEANKRWHMDWATAWGCADDLIMQPQQRRVRAARQKRIEEVSYEIPFFPDVDEAGAKDIIERIDGAMFRFLPEIMDADAQPTESSTTPEKLQERVFFATMTVDYLASVLYQIRAQQHGVTFNTKEYREAHSLGLIPPADHISAHILQTKDVDRSLGKMVRPYLKKSPGVKTVSFHEAQKHVHQIIHPNEGKKINQTPKDQELIAELEERKSLLKAAVQSLKAQPAKGSRTKGDAQILVEKIVDSVKPKVQLQRSEIKDRIIPQGQTWIHASYRIGLCAYSWLCDEGADIQVAKANHGLGLLDSYHRTMAKVRAKKLSQPSQGSTIDSNKSAEHTKEKRNTDRARAKRPGKSDRNTGRDRVHAPKDQGGNADPAAASDDVEESEDELSDTYHSPRQNRTESTILGDDYTAQGPPPNPNDIIDVSSESSPDSSPHPSDDPSPDPALADKVFYTGSEYGTRKVTPKEAAMNRFFSKENEKHMDQTTEELENVYSNQPASPLQLDPAEPTFHDTQQASNKTLEINNPSTFCDQFTEWLSEYKALCRSLDSFTGQLTPSHDSHPDMSLVSRIYDSLDNIEDFQVSVCNSITLMCKTHGYHQRDELLTAAIKQYSQAVRDLQRAIIAYRVGKWKYKLLKDAIWKNDDLNLQIKGLKTLIVDNVIRDQAAKDNPPNAPPTSSRKVRRRLIASID